MRITLHALLCLAGCALPTPTPTGVPFVSSQILGHWTGRWSVALPGQRGDADVTVTREPDLTVSWKMSLQGGLLSGKDEPPLLCDLRGADGVHSITLTGDGAKLGTVTLFIDEAGLIRGTAEPGGIPPVDLVGLVGGDYLRLDFVVLSVLRGQAEVVLDGAEGRDTGE